MTVKQRIEGWDIVDFAFDNDLCEPDCPWLHSWNERHPYGEGSAFEPLCECDLSRRCKGEEPWLSCPAYKRVEFILNED